MPPAHQTTCHRTPTHLPGQGCLPLDQGAESPVQPCLNTSRDGALPGVPTDTGSDLASAPLSHSHSRHDRRRQFLCLFTGNSDPLHYTSCSEVATHCTWITRAELPALEGVEDEAFCTVLPVLLLLCAGMMAGILRAGDTQKCVEGWVSPGLSQHMSHLQPSGPSCPLRLLPDLLGLPSPDKQSVFFPLSACLSFAAMKSWKTWALK